MPAFNLPDQQAWGSVIWAIVFKDHPRLIYSIVIAIAALLLVFALRFASRLRGNALLTQRFAGLADPGRLHQQLWLSGIPKKSRGASSHGRVAMSINQKMEFSKMEADGHVEQVHRDDSPVWHPNGANGSHNYVSSTTTKDLAVPRSLLSRPPLAPPLTAPTLSTEIFQFEERRFSNAPSIVDDIDGGFFQHSNPDHTSSVLTSTSTDVQQKDASPTTSRRSYIKMLPLGPPLPVAILEPDGLVSPSAPSSFPSSSPSLSPMPHDDFARERDVHDEIISETDDSDANWQRHTRVYGGGVCLACLAAGGDGGYYGDRVRPEERR